MSLRDDLSKVHAWCPSCDGSGMVMEFEPTDCPHLALHRMLESLEHGNELLSRIEAAKILRITPPMLQRLTDADKVPYQMVGRTMVFRLTDLMAVKEAITSGG